MAYINYSLNNTEKKEFIKTFKQELDNYKHNYSDENDYTEINDETLKIIFEKIDETLCDLELNIDLDDYEDDCLDEVKNSYEVFEDESDIVEHLEDKGYVLFEKDKFQSILDDEIDEKLKLVKDKFRFNKLELVKILDNYLL